MYTVTYGHSMVSVFTLCPFTGADQDKIIYPTKHPSYVRWGLRSVELAAAFAAGFVFLYSPVAASRCFSCVKNPTERNLILKSVIRDVKAFISLILE